MSKNVKYTANKKQKKNSMSEHQIRLFYHLAEYSQENTQSESLIYTEVPSRTPSFQVRLPISHSHKHFYIL